LNGKRQELEHGHGQRAVKGQTLWHIADLAVKMNVAAEAQLAQNRAQKRGLARTVGANERD